MAIILTIITGVILLALILLYYKRFHKSKYEKQKKHNLQYLKAELEEIGFAPEDIDNRLSYADENYVSDNAGDIEENLHNLLIDQRFYDLQEQHYTNQDNEL